MNTISISEIQRNLHKLDDFDIIEVVDKKRNSIKGYFLDKKYQKLVKSLVDEQRHKKDALLQAFVKASHNVSEIAPDIDILTLDEDMNSDLF